MCVCGCEWVDACEGMHVCVRVPLSVHVRM